jgi:hypothetical protein
MNYADFTTYPLEIQGITASSDEKISAIEAYVFEKLEYSGEDADLQEVLPYFVFFHFCEILITNVSASVGETKQIREESEPSTTRMMSAWNEGVLRITKICEENEQTFNEDYVSLRSFY